MQETSKDLNNTNFKKYNELNFCISCFTIKEKRGASKTVLDFCSL